MFKQPVDIQRRGSKKYWGKRQKGISDYELIARLPVFYGHAWLLFAKATKKEDKWMNFKLSVVGAIEGRANYGFGWNGERFAEGGDWGDIKVYRPLLLKRMLEELSSQGFIAKDYQP